MVVVIAFAGFQFFRANRPLTPKPGPTPFVSTIGTVVDETVNIPAGDFVSFKIALNRRARLKGLFQTDSRKNTVECLVVDAENFERWKNRSEYKSLAKTNYVPGGRIESVLAPGEYYLILDNRASSDSAKSVQANFSVE